jgi:sugar phosphate isomerase/epimerase
VRLGLSSAAAPGLPLPDLLAGCGRRGLGELELVTGTGAGPGDPDSIAAVVAAATDVGIRVAALAHDGPDAEAAVRTGARLGIPTVLRVADHPPVELCRLVRVAVEAGGRVLLMHGTEPRVVRLLRRAVDRLATGAAALAWEIDPATADPAAVPAVLRHAGPRLEYVRFRGGGPETAAQTGLGVGALVARLALARYGGPLVLAPSTSRALGAWRLWLGRAGGWGCGSRQSEPRLVVLTTPNESPGSAA